MHYPLVADGPLGWFNFLGNVNRPVTNMDVPECLWQGRKSLGICLGVV